MLDENNLKMDVYDYLNYCKSYQTIAVGVITDKQYLLYTKLENDNNSSHSGINEMLNKAIIKDGYDLNEDFNVYFYLIPNSLVICLPKSDVLSMSQYDFLNHILNQIVSFYRSNKIDKTITIGIVSKSLRRTYLDISKVVEFLQSKVSKDIAFNEEKIIGRTLPRQKIIENIKYNTGINDKIFFGDIKKYLNICNKYYNDSFYKEKFVEVFPDYLDIINLLSQSNNEKNTNNLNNNKHL